MKKLIALLLLAALVLSVLGGDSMAAPSGSRWNEQYFPNIELVNQHGKKVKFYDDLLKGKIVAINFIFTSCPQVCPLETAKMRQIQDVLGDQLGKDVFIYSISIDPERDTPEVLKKYAEKFGAKPGWQFLTGKKSDVSLLRTKLGMLRASEAETEKLGAHNTSLILGNEATGQWMKRSPMDNYKLLAGLLMGDLQNFRNAIPGRKSYAEAPKLGPISKGATLWRTRCASCHSVGGGEGVGPDLAGVVEKRPRAWLTRWIKAPDKMLAEKDPVALELFKKYRELPMPNLDLNDAEAGELIRYIDEETRRFQSQNVRMPARK